jgi:hypothetical protein
VPEFEQDIREDKDAKQKQLWVKRLTEDPYNLFNMLGEGERRQDNMTFVRRRTLRFLQFNHPDVDQTVAHVLITYCFVLREDHKRVLLNWLAGQDVEESEAKALGLPTSWVPVDDQSSDRSTLQQREEQALRAIRTIGILSMYYQPLILAFDQLEGFRDQPRLTQAWGDTVREIFTMAPNFLVLTCIFPSLWETWFVPQLDQSVAERIAQQQVVLETFAPRHGLQMLATHLEPSFTKHRLPTNIFPFTEQDVSVLCQHATSPRSFLQAARSTFQSWLDGDDVAALASSPAEQVVSQDKIDELLTRNLADGQAKQRLSFESEMLVEQDVFGRFRNLSETVLEDQKGTTELTKATCAHFVMPPNVVIRDRSTGTAVCLAFMNSEGTSFAARMRNLNKCLERGDQFRGLVMLRDRRCRRLGARSEEHLDYALKRDAVLVHAGAEEMSCLNAAYDALVAVEEHDLCIGKHVIDKGQFVAFLRATRFLGQSEFLRNASRRSAPLASAIGLHDQMSSMSDGRSPVSLPGGFGQQSSDTTPAEWGRASGNGTPADVVIGDDVLESPHVGVVGTLRDGHRKLAISLTKPQCLVLLGYMGSGKSYALGVLIENALLAQPGLIHQTRPMTAVAFNYRRNPQARFEYGGFAKPNSRPEEVTALADGYKAVPSVVGKVNVFNYEAEIARRGHEYQGLSAFPLQFRPDELGADHWEILMKPPTKEAEYMDIIRDIIQKLFYQERLTFKNLERDILTDERLSPSQQRRAKNRLSFAQRWIADHRSYEWVDVLREGTLNVVDLRMQAMEASEALKLCLIVTDLVRRTKNGVNKMIVFDEAHEYVDSRELVAELENSITQIRHDGLSFVLASQFPERIPERIFKYLLTRLVFKLPNAKAINYVRKAAPFLDGLSPQGVANLDLEQGLCFVQTDDDCTDTLLKVPQQLKIRPRCTLHGGATIRQGADDGIGVGTPTLSEHQDDMEVGEPGEWEESEVEVCPQCGGDLVVRRGPVGPFIGCSAYPSCRYTKKLM